MEESVSTNIDYYSLFHVDPKENLHTNLPGEKNPIDVYLACAVTVAKSIRALGGNFCLITNSSEFIEVRLGELFNEKPFDVLQLSFDRVVPSGIQFYSAHFKLDVLKYFASLPARGWIGLIDLDAVLLQPIVPPTGEGEVLAYDISRHVPANVTQRVTREMTEIGGGAVPVSTWYGGEFLIGRPAMYSELARRIDVIWPRYRERIGSIFHVGMEWPVSIGLRMLEVEGLKIIDCGQDNRVARWWSARAPVRQQPFSAASKAAYLHLPSDKPFLARQSKVKFEPDSFLSDYRRYVGPRLIARKMTNPVLNLVRRETRFVASL